MPAALRDRPQQPILWLTQNTGSLSDLPSGSRWILWQRSDDRNALSDSGNRGLVIASDDSVAEMSLEKSLQVQLQQAIG